MIFEKIISWIVSIMILFYVPYTIYFNIVHFVCKWKCRKKKYLKPFCSCHNSNCKWSRFCDDYEHIYTDEEIKQLHKMIDEYHQTDNKKA